MITTPLAPIVAFLRKHGADLACLEGAPMGARCEEHVAQARLLYLQGGGEPGPGVLYLGTSTICRAALGWVAQVLALARRPGGASLCFLDDEIELWAIAGKQPIHRWYWMPDLDVAAWEGPTWTRLPGPMPTTPAARLKAVIEYEVSR